MGDDVNIEKANNSLISNDRSWKRSKFRLTYVAEAPELTQGAKTGSPQGFQGRQRVRCTGSSGGKEPNLSTHSLSSCITFLLFQSCFLPNLLWFNLA